MRSQPGWPADAHVTWRGARVVWIRDLAITWPTADVVPASGLSTGKSHCETWSGDCGWPSWWLATTTSLDTYNKAGRQQRRAKLVEMLGGKCIRCGAVEDLEFDHIDPATKRFAVGSSMSRAWDELVAEALKCQLLCPPCHREKAVQDRPEPAHRLLPLLVLRLSLPGMPSCQRCQERPVAPGQDEPKPWGKRGDDGAALGLGPLTCAKLPR